MQIGNGHQWASSQRDSLNDKKAPSGTTYICCHEEKNNNVSRKEPQVSEGIQEKELTGEKT